MLTITTFLLLSFLHTVFKQLLTLCSLRQADTFRIELIIIQERLPGRTRHEVFCRGDPNGRQVIMFLKNDGSYIPMEPLFETSHKWRYNAHLPHVARPRALATPLSIVQQSPVLARDAGGRLVLSHAGILNMAAGMAPHVAPWHIPPSYDETPQRTDYTTPVHHSVWLNTGEWC